MGGARGACDIEHAHAMQNLAGKPSFSREILSETSSWQDDGRRRANGDEANPAKESADDGPAEQLQRHLCFHQRSNRCALPSSLAQLWRFTRASVSPISLLGAGKTTLATKLAEKMNLPVFYEPVIDNVYLDDFYKNPARYGFPLQVCMFSVVSRAVKVGLAPSLS